MPAVVLTQKEVDRLKPGDREIYDDEVRGLTIRPGERSVVWRVRVPVSKRNGKWSYKSEKIGTRDTLSLKEARDRAKSAMERLKRLHADAEILDEQVKKSGLTLEMALADYLRECRRRNRSDRTIDGYDRVINRYLADWLETPIAEIGRDRRAFKRRFEEVTDNNGKYAANGMVRSFSALYKYAAKLDDHLPTCPSIAVTLHPNKPRKIAYRPDELPAAIEAVCRLNRFRACLHLGLFLSGCRQTAFKTAKIKNFHPSKKLLLLENHKGKDFSLPLSDALLSVISASVEMAKESFPDGEYIFPAHTLTGHIEEVAVSIPPPEALVEYREKRGIKSTKVKSHLWRHTFISLATAAGLSGADARRLSDHKVANDAHEQYNSRHAMWDYLCERQQQMSQYLLKCANLPEDHEFTPRWLIIERETLKHL